MDRRNIAKLIGITSSFIFLLYIFTITIGGECFSPSQLFITYTLIIYTIGIEIYDVAVPRR